MDLGLYYFNEKIGNVSFHSMMNEAYTRPFSDQTSWLVDQEVKNMIDVEYERAKNLLREHRHSLDLLAAALLEKEVLHRADLEAIVGKRPFEEAAPVSEESVLPVVEGVPPVVDNVVE